MDVARPDLAIKRKKRRLRLIIISVVGLVAVTVGLSLLKPAVPTVDRNLVYIDTVKRGPLIRQIQGTGTLVPEDVRWIVARVTGRAEKIVLKAGAQVTPDSVIVQLFNPDAENAANQADLQLKVAEAELVNLRLDMQSSVLSEEAAANNRQATYDEAFATNLSDKRLAEKGFLSPSDLRRSDAAVVNTRLQNEAGLKRLAFVKDSVAPKIAAKEAAVEALRATARQKREEADGLQVRAGMKGVIQAVPVEIGTQIGGGTKVARVADPARLKAEVRVAETQAKDVRIGQVASVDTRNGIVPAKVTRVDPAVVGGTVTVDLEITGELPQGARPDLSIDGIVELERLADVLSTGRPAFGTAKGPVGVFRLEEDGVHASRVTVKFGRSSVSAIEIVSGLEAGDKIILSDMSAQDGVDRIQLK